MSYLSLCVACGCSIPYTFSLCLGCFEEYGSDRTAWPEWLLFLVRDDEKERKRYEARRKYETEIDEIYLRSCSRLAVEGMSGRWAGATWY